MTPPVVRTTGPATSRRSALVALAVACVVLFVGLYFVAVRTEVGQRIDEAAIEGRGGTPCYSTRSPARSTP